MEGLQMYVYSCEGCCMVFGVETKFEDQAIIVCPACKSDEQLEEVGTADVKIIELADPQK